jgi:division protein CdvB (Snf7/Vps24/ESCRT-III family)
LFKTSLLSAASIGGCVITVVRGFIDKWKPKEKEETLTSKIKNVGKKQEPIKTQIAQVTQRLDMQTRSLDAAVARFQTREDELFNRVVKAMTNRETARANILATELSELRKAKKFLNNASLALQSVSMRLSTVSEMGDLVTILGPAKNALGGISNDMCSIFPQASEELGNIGNLLSEIMVTTQQNDMQQVSSTMASADALSILEEAEAAAGNQLQSRLPEIDSFDNVGVRKRASLDV